MKHMVFFLATTMAHQLLGLRCIKYMVSSIKYYMYCCNHFHNSLSRCWSVLFFWLVPPTSSMLQWLSRNPSIISQHFRFPSCGFIRFPVLSVMFPHLPCASSQRTSWANKSRCHQTSIYMFMHTFMYVYCVYDSYGRLTIMTNTIMAICLSFFGI